LLRRSRPVCALWGVKTCRSDSTSRRQASTRKGVFMMSRKKIPARPREQSQERHPERCQERPTRRRIGLDNPGPPGTGVETVRRNRRITLSDY
jgi:hypothetical protein